MKINRVEVGYLSCNCYILDIDNKVLVIDPGDEYDKIKPYLNNKEVLGVILTHRHFDHVGALEDIVNDYKIEVYDNSNLEEKEYKIDNFKFKIIRTYGHTMDSICIYFEDDKIMFTGDFLFKESIGRTDFDTSSYNDMLKSIAKIKMYDPDIKIYPGHGPYTSLEHELTHNQFLGG